jgi:hypothetical protein
MRDWLMSIAKMGRELDLHSGTVNAVCEQYAKSRSQKKRPCLRYRGRKTLAAHDRDVNAALNILRRGRATPVVGIPVF